MSAVPRVGGWVFLGCSDFISSAVAVWHEEQTLLPGEALLLSGIFFLHVVQEEKYQTGLFGSFYIARSSHVGRWELMFHRLRALSLRVFCKFSGRSFAAGHHHPLGRGNVAVGLFCVALSWGGSWWHCLLSGWVLILSTSAAGDAGWHQWSKFTSFVTSCTADAS